MSELDHTPCTPCEFRKPRTVIVEFDGRKLVAEYVECEQRGKYIGPRDERPAWCPNGTGEDQRCS